MYRRSLGRPGWAIPNRSGDGVSDKSARVESPRATGLSSVAFASGVMETHLLTGERNISLQSQRLLTLQTLTFPRYHSILPKHPFNPAYRLTNAILILDQGEANVGVTVVAKTNTG